MEPVTHILTGACLARTGLNRRAAYTTLTMAVAAQFPDIDTLWGLRGPVDSFQHHRGITHTFLGVPFEAALLVAGVYVLHLWRVRRHRRPSATQAGFQKPLTAAPVRWGLLYSFAVLALLSHLLLDYTNNYGIRPFFPFNPRWYAASITFIFDPAMFALLLAAAVLPSLFRLVSTEVGARRQPFAARGWAVAALVGVVSLWGWRAVEHSRAVVMAAQQSTIDPASYGQQGTSASETTDAPLPLEPAHPLHYLAPERVLASPDPINPFRWYSVIDFGPLYPLGTVDLRAGTYVAAQSDEMKPAPKPVLRAAERSQLGRVYLDWSPMPILETLPASNYIHGPEEPAEPGSNVVIFRDPRFMGDIPWLHMGRRRSPLTGTVEIDAQGAVVRETMDGRVQR